MTPNTDDRLASIVRALTDVILPALPPDAGLAKEQIQLSIGHIQILRAQFDAIPAFEAEEFTDALNLGKALEKSKGKRLTKGAVASLKSALRHARTTTDAAGMRQSRTAINKAIANLVVAMAADGDAKSRVELSKTILDHETVRSMKDRRWFAPFGFDSISA